MQIRGILTLILATALASSAAAQAYLAVDEFSTASNPSGTWSYGKTATLGGSFVLFTNPVVLVSGQMEGWGLAGGFPFVAGNLTAGVVQNGTTFYPPGLLAMHPDNSGNFAVLRWTAPSAGTYQISAGFADIPNDAEATADVHVRLNSLSSLFSVGLDGTTTSATYNSTPLALSGGDTIDFVVGSGGNGYVNDHTALAAVIVAVPEPAVISLVVGSIAALGLLLRRRGQAGER